MAHHSRVRSAGNSWLTILPAEFASLDTNLAASIDGDNGGCYAPASAIVITGSGLASTVPVNILRGGALTTATPSTIQLASGYFPGLSATHAGRTHKFCQSFADSRLLPSYMFRARRDTGSIQSIAPTYNTWKNSTFTPARLLLRLRAHNGGTLTKVTIGFRVSTPHPSVPTMPAARVIRVDTSGNVVALSSTATGANSQGFVSFATPGSADSWYNNGAGQTFAFKCDQNNLIDRTQYSYYLDVLDESGLSGWPWQLTVMQPVLAISLNTNVGLSPTDGITPSDGSRMIVLTGNNSQLGLWLAHSGQWTRATDLQLPGQFTQGLLVGVEQGHKYGGSWWQAASTTTTWTPGTEPNGAGVWQSGQTYTSGQAVIPTTAHTTGYWYTCSTGGTSGGSEPAWIVTPGQQVIDNSVTWTCAGIATPPLTFVTRPDADTATDGSAIVAHGTIWQGVVCEYDGITNTAWQ